MRRSEIVSGSIILGVGILLLVGALFNIDLWGLICPTALIGLGVWIIFRTRKEPRDSDLKIKFVGDIRREGVWQPQNEEIWGFVLDSRLDFSAAILPDGETVYQVGAFVNDIRATVPEDVGVAVNSMAFMTESRILGEKQDTLFMPFHWESDNFDRAIKKIILKPFCFVSEIRVEQLSPEI
jgi:predicted membrane protein